jgi:CheY-like chemotaxis protein/HPt (histidine-containing phosphotransfer) domain-containing protein
MLRHEMFEAMNPPKKSPQQPSVPTGSHHSSSSSSSSVPRRLRVLLAEDGLVNQRIAVRLLERLGHQVEIAENGQSAVDAWRRGGVDAILMDWQMPGLNGGEATELIRSEEASGHHVPIIAMTATSAEVDRERCLSCGMDDYISKPINPEVLRDTLAKLASAMRATPERAVGEALNADPPASDATIPAQECASVAAPRSGPEPTYRWIDIEYARERMGGCDDEILRQLAEILLEESAQRVAEIDAGLLSKDSGLITRSAHTLKSAAKNFDAADLAETAGQIERLGRENLFDPIRDGLQTLKERVHAVDEELRAFLQRL